MKLSATVTGLADLQRVIAALGPVTMKEGVAGLYQEALIEQKESMRRTPVLTGALRASHETEKPVMVNPSEAVIRILVGGPAGAGFARFAKGKYAKKAQVVDPSTRSATVGIVELIKLDPRREGSTTRGLFRFARPNMGWTVA